MLMASEARQIAEEATKNHIAQELSRIESKIIEACEKGETSYSFIGCIGSAVKKELEYYGYKVKTRNQYHKPYVIIKW